MTEEVKRPWFGLHPPGGVGAAWGARAIYDVSKMYGKPYIVTRSVSLVHDRQSVRGDEKELKAIVDWVNRRGIHLLYEELAAHDLSPGDAQYLEMSEAEEDATFHLHASPRGSYGYIYLVAWVDR